MFRFNNKNADDSCNIGKFDYNYNSGGDFMSVKVFKDLVLFSLEQVNYHIKIRNKEYESNKELENSKPRVYRENLVVFQEEELYLEKTKDYISKIDPENIDSPEDFIELVLSEIKAYYKENGVPGVCLVILSEKLKAALDFYKKLISD